MRGMKGRSMVDSIKSPVVDGLSGVGAVDGVRDGRPGGMFESSGHVFEHRMTYRGTLSLTTLTRPIMKQRRAEAYQQKPPFYVGFILRVRDRCRFVRMYDKLVSGGQIDLEYSNW